MTGLEQNIFEQGGRGYLQTDRLQQTRQGGG